MMHLPIIPHIAAEPPPDAEALVDRVAAAVRQRYPCLARDEQFRHLVPRHLDDAPTLHLDDLSGISMLDQTHDSRFLQERARFRAGEGDLVASVYTSGDEWEPYCRDRLRLGRVTWIHPEPLADPIAVALACWEDRAARRDLVAAMKHGGLRYLHPYLAYLPAWELANLLRRASRCRLEVIGPTPGLARLVNHKLVFADIVRELLGDTLLPRTEEAGNFAALSLHARRIAETSSRVGIKLPDSAGGGGTIVLDAARLRNRPLHRIRRELREALDGLDWRAERRLLVCAWEAEARCSPSAQMWIPPAVDGPPVTEGLFIQTLEGVAQMFMGSRPADFTPEVQRLVVNPCWLVSLLLQRLGYVGRASFDTLLLEDEHGVRVQLIECNGRWGGTSMPMTLVNRLRGDWKRQPYAARACRVDGLDRLRFGDVLEHFADDLYDATTGAGRLIFYNPGRMLADDAVNVLALGRSWDEAAATANLEVPARLAELVGDGAGVRSAR